VPQARPADTAAVAGLTRARTEIGFAPRVELREGIRRTLNWYRAEGWL